ncbi:MAG: lipocalin family protein [Pseudomonadota bacterium]
MLRSPLKKLEAEISDCEARVRLHDTRLRHGLQVLREGALQAVSGKVLLAGGALLGSALGLWWSVRRERADARRGWAEDDDEDRRARRHARRRRHRQPLSEQLRHWAPLLLPFLTPLLDRKVAMSLHRLGLPVNVRPVDPLPTVQALDLGRFAGRWYEIARLPTRHERRCSRDVTAEYAPDGQGGVVVRNRCVRDDGRLEQAEGRLRIPDPRLPGEAEVSFVPEFLRWWPGAWADYYVLFVDVDYQVALVGTPERDRLWVLARKPEMEAGDLEALKSLALRHGFDSTRLISTPHTEPAQGVSQAAPDARLHQAAQALQ